MMRKNRPKRQNFLISSRFRMPHKFSHWSLTNAECLMFKNTQNQVDAVVASLLGLVVKFGVSYPSDTATLISNINEIGSAHYPELCLAWMQSMDGNYMTDAGLAFQSSAYRIIHINCPVDVDVYDSSGTLVSQIKSEQPQKVDGNSIVATIDADGEKLVYLPVSGEYTMKMTARDDCTVDYTVSEFSEQVGNVTRFLNYYDVPVKQGKTLTGTVPSFSGDDRNSGIPDGSSTDYTLTDAQSTKIAPNVDMKGNEATQAYYTVTPATENENAGIVMGGGVRQLGNYALVTAQPNVGYAFSGWYEGGNLVSTDASYRFRVMQDVTLTAKFTASVSDTQYKITVGNSKHGTIEVNPSSATGGAHVIVTATPDVGYVLKEIYVDGVTIKGSDFTVPTHDVTVTADFEPAAPSSSTSSETPSVSKGGTTPGKTSIVQKNGTTSSPEGGTSVISGSGSHIVNPDTGVEMGAGVVGVLAVFGVALVIITARKRKRK